MWLEGMFTEVWTISEENMGCISVNMFIYNHLCINIYI